MKIREDESGQMLVMTALSLAILLGFVALAVDVGVLFRAQRNVQIAADAAAIAAALDYQYSPSPSPTAAADAAALANGVASSYVTVNSPPANGYHTGLGYIEVLVSQPNPTYFMRVFGFNSLNVAARSVAGTIPSPSCIYILDPTDANTLILQGNDTIIAPNCGIQVNSNSQSALCVTGGSSTVTAPYINVVGAQSGAGNCKGVPDGTTVQPGVSPIQDPLQGLVPPDPATACTGGNTISLGGTAKNPPTITAAFAATIPSKYTSSYSVGGNSVNVTCFADPNVILGDGVNLGTPVSVTDSKSGVTSIGGSNQVFLFENGVTIGGTVNIYGTLDNYQGTFSQGNSSLTVDGPVGTSYPYNGIGIMQPASNTTGTCSSSGANMVPCLQIQFGSSSSGTLLGNLNGLVYAPTSEVYMQDNGGGSVLTGIIAYTMFEKTSTLNITDSYNAAHPSTTPLSTVAMVE